MKEFVNDIQNLIVKHWGKLVVVVVVVVLVVGGILNLRNNYLEKIILIK